MISYHCDGCQKEIPRDALRYVVSIDVRAAYEEMEVGLMDLVRDHREEMLALIERLKEKSAEEIEATVYKGFKLDLCPSCQQAFLRDPLRFHPEQGGEDRDIGIDVFLRSLGYGKGPEDGAAGGGEDGGELGGEL